MEKILKISVVVILLVAIIYLIVGTFFNSSAKTSTEFGGFGQMVSTKTSSRSTDKLEVALDKVLINMISGQYRYMKADMSFKMKNEKDTEQLKKSMTHIRDTILRFSASQDSDKLSTDEGKQQFKKDLKDLIYESYGLEIEQVYFRNFVLAP